MISCANFFTRFVDLTRIRAFFGKRVKYRISAYPYMEYV